VELKDRVRARYLILTHFNHENKPHDELEEWAKGLDGVTAAYDGLEVEA
jgi:phosphoribosyl 1,2-cyclic phosphodiesterase